MLGFVLKETYLTAVVIPPGQVAEIIGPTHDDGLVVVSVKDEPIRVFASDLKYRRVPINPPGAAAEPSCYYGTSSCLALPSWIERGAAREKLAPVGTRTKG
jgi:hypothetical protein